MVDGNDLYEAVMHTERDPNAPVRAALAEIAQGMAFLTDQEQGFVVGVEANLDMHAPLTKRDRYQLGQILRNLRNKRHQATSSR